MPRPIKYSPTTTSGSYQKGNVAIGTNPIAYDSTWVNSPVISNGTFVVTEVGAVGVPKFYSPTNDNEWIRLAKQEGATGANTGSVNAVKSWFASQANYDVANIDLPLGMPNIVGNGQIINLDAEFTESYPGSGTTWTDLSGVGNNGTLYNGPTFNNGAKYIQFDGVDDYAATISPGNTGSIQFTYYWTGLSQKVITGNISGYAMLYNGGSGVVIHWYPANGTYEFLGLLPNRAGWYNITLTWGGTNDNKMYMNGALVMSSTVYSISKPPIWYWAGNHYSSQAIRLQTIQTYNKILTPSEVLQNHHKGNIVTDGLVLAVDAGNIVSYESGSTLTYNLSGSSNSTFQGTLSVDISGSLINGTSYNSENGGVWSFDGVDDYINFGNQSSLGFTSGVFSVETWVYIPSSWTAGSQYPNLVSKGATAGWDTNGWSLFCFRNYGDGTGYSLGVGLRNTGNVNIALSYNQPANTWLHVVGTLDGSFIKIYVNGELQANQSQTVNPASNSTNVLIGRDSNGLSFPGKIGISRTYNRTLSSQEVLQNFNAQRSRFEI
jgi:hypothetical protein